MWKKLITFAIASTLTLSTSFAQNKINLPLLCPPPQKITEVLTNYKEDITFIGIDTHHKVEKLTLILYFNTKTKTYTLMFAAPSHNITCIVSSGELGEVIVKD